jgi:restriction system protein
MAGVALTGAVSMAPASGMATLSTTIGQVDQGRKLVSLSTSAILIPAGQNTEGLLVKSCGAAWVEIASFLGNNWTAAYDVDARKWEEILAGALHKEGFSVTLTPRSKDHGRDVIAEKSGVGCIRMLGSMKAYAPDHLVSREHVHEVLGVVEAERATKGMIVTTSDFAPQLFDAPGLAALIPNRLELKNGVELQDWLKQLTSTSTSA